jgi:hypothetical protein
VVLPEYGSRELPLDKPFLRYFVHNFRGMSLRHTGRRNMEMGPAGPGTKNDCAGEGQQQITRPTETCMTNDLWYLFLPRETNVFFLRNYRRCVSSVLT